MYEISLFEDVIAAHVGKANLIGSKISIYLFFVDGLLVDTGPASLSRQNKQFFEEHPIDQVVLTHIHEDHCGMAAWLQENLQVPIYLHPSAIETASRHASIPLYRRKMWGNRPAFFPRPIPKTIRTPEHRFRVINAPGHCNGHIVLFEENKGWLFTGDIFVRTRQYVAFKEENLSLMISTLNTLLELDFQTIFCAHSGVQRNGYALLKEKLDFLLDLQEKIQEMLRQGMSWKTIDNKMFPKKHPITYVSMGEGSSYQIIKTLGD